MLANSLAKIGKFLASQNWGEKKKKKKKKNPAGIKLCN